MKNLKAIIFDMDDVIVHGQRFSKRLSEDHDISLETTASFFKGPFQDCLIGKADLKKELEEYISVWRWDKSVDELLDYWFADEHNRIDERFIPFIEELRQRGIKCYMGTNNEKYRTQHLVENRGLGKIFDGIYSSAGTGLKKPSKDFYEYILKDIGLNGSEVLFCDDDIENIHGAAEAGIHTHLFTKFEDLKELLE